MDLDKVNVRLNVNVPVDLKRRIKICCANEDMEIKELVILAIESLLDELEKGKPV